eukprot:1603489-Rhodomonas_salina.5
MAFIMMPVMMLTIMVGVCSGIPGPTCRKCQTVLDPTKDYVQSIADQRGPYASIALVSALDGRVLGLHCPSSLSLAFK